ncbi:MAG: hypothetical protein HQ582_32145 [Planctomycetes bacterium]|nr:hypothetical protein [Planctomycetota bacterium]
MSHAPVGHGNDSRWAAIYLSRFVTDKPAGVAAHYFGGVSRPAISKTVARTEKRREEERDWDRRLAKLSEQFTQSGRSSETHKS